MGIIRVLAVGDVCGKPGLTFLNQHLKKIQKEHHIDFTVVNGENANVVGVKPSQCEEIFKAGATVITLGNHTWVRREIQDYLNHVSCCLRPANYAPQCPGRGYGIYEMPFGRICVINLLGRFTLDPNTDNPMVVVDDILSRVEADADVILVDFHAEASSEKRAMGYFLENRVSAVWGTHTHVQTSDCCILEGGAGYISDLGMTGSVRSVLGVDIAQSIGRCLGDPPQRYSSGGGPAKMECAVFEIDAQTGKCLDAHSHRFIFEDKPGSDNAKSSNTPQTGK